MMMVFLPPGLDLPIFPVDELARYVISHADFFFYVAAALVGGILLSRAGAPTKTAEEPVPISGGDLLQTSTTRRPYPDLLHGDPTSRARGLLPRNPNTESRLKYREGLG